MMRWTSLGAMFGGLSVLGAALLVGCAPPPAPEVDEAIRADAEAVSATVQTGDGPEERVPAAPVAVSSVGTLRIREIKVIEDNGQHGIFAKLSTAPNSESHFTLAEPNRLIIELEGDVGGGPLAAQYPVDNPAIKQVAVGSHEGKIRISVTVKGEEFPSYTVDTLNDTLVAFLGEPRGSSEPVREQIIFTERALPGTAPPPAPVAEVPAHQQLAAAELPPSDVTVRSPSAKKSREPVGKIQSAGGAGHDAEPQADVDFVRKGVIYYGQPISLDLKEADIHNVLRLMAEVSKLNVVATSDVKGNVTLRLFDVPWDQALDIVLQVMSLESVREGNVVRVSTVKRLREEREEQIKAREARREAEPLRVAYVRVNYAKAKNLVNLISGTGKGAAKAGGKRSGAREREQGVLTPRGSVMADEFTNTLIIRDIERGITDATDLVRRLDVQTPEILIESNIVEASTDFARDLGVQWGYRASVGPQTGSATGYNFPGTVGFGGAGLGAGSSGVPFLADFPAGGNFGPKSGSALDLALGSLDGTQALDSRITALEEQGKARIISRPRLVTLNNVSATIKSVTILRVRMPSTGTQVATGGAQVSGGSTATEKIETGITLKVTPQVSSDGFVMLDLYAKSSQADFSRTVDNIPTEILREANSHVLVRDGQTFVIGGVYRDSRTETMKGVPFFGSVPGLAWLFHNESRSKRREDLLVFITPRIVGSVKAFGGLPTASELWQRRAGSGEPG